MTSWFDIVYEPPIKRGEPYPLFNRMSIETSSKCNRRCPFCPISIGVRDFQQTLIDDDVFTSLVEQVKALNDRHANLKCVEMFRLNEPLLDPRYAERIRAMRVTFPRTTLYCATNGDVLCAGFDMDKTIRKLTKLKDAGLNVMSIDVYDGKDESERFDFFMRLVKAGPCLPTEHRYRQHAIRNLYVMVTDCRTATFFDKERPITEGWNNCGIRKIEAPRRRCPRPMRHLVVLHDGTVPICCVVNPGDASIPRLGDLRKDSVTDIWNCDRIHNYRHHLQRGWRDLPGCDNCDARVAYAHVVRKVEK